MRIYTILFIMLSYSAFSQNDKSQYCNWLEVAQKTNTIESELGLIQSNFNDNIGSRSVMSKRKGECKIVFVLNINDQHWVLTDIYFREPKKVIQIIKPEEIDEIGVYGADVAQKLYAADGLIIMQSTSKALEKRIWKIR